MSASRKFSRNVMLRRKKIVTKFQRKKAREERLREEFERKQRGIELSYTPVFPGQL